MENQLNFNKNTIDSQILFLMQKNKKSYNFINQKSLINKMADFKYDSYDVTAMKVAFERLRQTQQRGFWWGVLAGVPAGLLLLRNIKKTSPLPVPMPMAVAIPLLSGSLIYGVYTWNARSDYTDTAQKINRKYAKIINKIINY